MTYLKSKHKKEFHIFVGKDRQLRKIVAKLLATGKRDCSNSQQECKVLYNLISDKGNTKLMCYKYSHQNG